MKYKNIPKELLERFAAAEFGTDLHVLTEEIYDFFYKPVWLVEEMMVLGFNDREIQEVIDKNWATEGGRLKFENAVEKMISGKDSIEKAGTREGALKAWKTRRRSLLDKLKDAISRRDARAVVRLKQQLSSGAKSVQEIYGKE